MVAMITLRPDIWSLFLGMWAGLFFYVNEKAKKKKCFIISSYRKYMLALSQFKICPSRDWTSAQQISITNSFMCLAKGTQAILKAVQVLKHSVHLAT